MVSGGHIQNFSEAASLQPHWGYAYRVVPCTNDAGSCEYLDSVYWSHDVSMLYSFILWAVIGGILLVWGLGRWSTPSRRSTATTDRDDGEPSVTPQNRLYRLSRLAKVTVRRCLLPESAAAIFGRTTRLQVLLLAILIGYLLVFTFIGVVYRRWVTPVRKMPGTYNIRTGLGPWSNRVGVLAFALTPLSVLLSSRESLLSLITGVPYQHFNFLHRWLGYIIFLQAALHTLGWTIVEARLYQPQPTVWNAFIAQLYMIWGVVAMVFVSFLFVFSTRWAVRLTGYEFFRKAHYVAAMLYIGACWGHWSKLNCWMIASLGVWLLDRGVRLLRTAWIHHGSRSGDASTVGFRGAAASITRFADGAHGDVVRLDFEHDRGAWYVGQHFFLCFPELSVWQSHPFTPSSVPGRGRGSHAHSYIIRSKRGQTRRLAELSQRKQERTEEERTNGVKATTSVVITGPYGRSIVNGLAGTSDVNVLCVAGGTGVTFVLPILTSLVAGSQSPTSSRMIELIWVIRKRSDMLWIQDELNSLELATQTSGLRISIFVTREDETDDTDHTAPDPIDGPKNAFITVEEQNPESDTSTRDCVTDDELASPSSFFSPSSPPNHLKELGSHSPSFRVHKARASAASSPSARHPDLVTLVRTFVAGTIRGPTRVYASGPGGMISDLRGAVASCNSAGKVWRGDERCDVELVGDERVEW